MIKLHLHSVVRRELDDVRVGSEDAAEGVGGIAVQAWLSYAVPQAHVARLAANQGVVAGAGVVTTFELRPWYVG